MTEEKLKNPGRRRFMENIARGGAGLVLAESGLAGLAESTGHVFNITAEWQALDQQKKGPSEGQGTLSAKEFAKYKEVLKAYNESAATVEQAPTFKFIGELKTLNDRAQFTDNEATNISGRLIYEGAREKKKGLIVDVSCFSQAARGMEFAVDGKTVPLKEMLENGLTTTDPQYNIPSWGEQAASLQSEIKAKTLMLRGRP